MQSKCRTRPLLRLTSVAVLAGSLLAVPAVAGAETGHRSTTGHHRNDTAVALTDVVSDLPGRAQITDPALVNPWGMSLSPTSPVWTSNNGTDSATLYTGGVDGAAAIKVPLNVPIDGGAPTGQVFNDTTAFTVSGAGGSGSARFIFASESGNITAWNPAAGPDAQVQIHVPGAVYKGLALLHTPVGPFLLAADFHHARIDVFDGSFQRVFLPAPFFWDRHLPLGYAPFNVAVLDDRIFVSYAKQDATGTDEIAGKGKGFVDEYVGFGLAAHRIASHGTLNAPWGLAIAPESFGRLAGDLLVGNFGDGRITAFDAWSGRSHGLLRDERGRVISIDGLWALLQGTAASGGTDALWFSAGIDDEAHGLVGLITSAD
ncbi:MAG: TIGR03118 family protein [Mycobacteriales bacterium]